MGSPGHHSSFDYSSTFGNDDYAQPALVSKSQVDDEAEEAFNAKWRKISIGLLVIAIIFNVGVGSGVYVATFYRHKAQDSSEVPSSGPFGQEPRLRAFTLKNDKGNTGEEYPDSKRIQGWKTSENLDGVRLVDESYFRIELTDSDDDIFQIYSHLAFNSSNKNEPIQFQQTLFKQTKDRPESLVIDLGTVKCSPSPDKACYNSVLFSALQLKNGDIIYLEVNEPTLLDRRETRSFFGIYKIH